MADCIDVEARFPGYKLGYEDPAFKGTQDPWHKVIECRAGHICPAGGDKLWACTKTRTSTAASAIRRPRCFRDSLPVVIKMDGSDGINAEFSVSDAKQMFTVMGAKRR